MCIRDRHRDFLYPQGIDNDMNVNVAAVVMPVGVGADNGLVSTKMRFAKFLSKLLCLVNGQSVISRVTRIKADDVVVAFHILPFLVFAVSEIGAHTRNGEIFIATVECRYAVILT